MIQDILWKVTIPESCDVLIVFEYFITEGYRDVSVHWKWNEEIRLSGKNHNHCIKQNIRATIYTLNKYNENGNNDNIWGNICNNDNK